MTTTKKAAPRRKTIKEINSLAFSATGFTLTVDVKFHRAGLRTAIKRERNHGVEYKTDAAGQPLFSLSQCAHLIGVAGDSLNYYFKTGVVEPAVGEPGTKKYFDLNGLLALWIIVSAKTATGVNVDFIEFIQNNLNGSKAKSASKIKTA